MLRLCLIFFVSLSLVQLFCYVLKYSFDRSGECESIVKASYEKPIIDINMQDDNGEWHMTLWEDEVNKDKLTISVQASNLKGHLINWRSTSGSDGLGSSLFIVRDELWVYMLDRTQDGMLDKVVFRKGNIYLALSDSDGDGVFDAIE